MSATPTTELQRSAHELRVLGGPQQGAVLPLQPQRRYTVGSEWGADIVLREPAPGATAGSARLELRAEGVLLEALTGHVSVDSQPLVAGESRLLGWASAWQVGEATLAAGPPGAWAAASAAEPAAEAPARTAPTPQQVQGWGRRLAAGGATVAAASLSMLALAWAIAPTEPRPEALAQRAQASLHAAGMHTVTVSLAPGMAEPVVQGYLDTHAQRTRAETLLAELGLRPRFAVWINESLAQAVQDVYRVHGISAQVQPLGPGQVRVTTALNDVTPLAAVEQTVRRDVQGLNRLDTQNAPPAGVPSPIPDVHDPGKRVASIVAGSEPYVVTQDGTRYFIGALLPTGHRILAIADGRVELEREGQNTALVF
jgi:type III secretion protein D